ncbi:protein FAM210A-like [Babylonia areolata]|uniref:protein FAM210A-like n=1 Tax=Babylonia areolata TaxID=304850 RepID=UPI003FD5D484
MFRSVSRSYRLLNGLAVSSFRACRPVGADDVTKFSTGLLHQMHREHQLAAPVRSTQTCSRLPYCLGLNPLPSHTLLHGHTPLNNMTRLWLHPSPPPPGLSVMQVVNYSTGQEGKSPTVTPQTAGDAVPAEGTPAGEENLSIFKRFKRAYKEHGKILVMVHVATSIVWYGSFYALARGGIDVVPWMEHYGFSETMIKPFRAGGLGDFAVAYLMYKLATPVRYTVTLAGTNFVIRYRRRKGMMAPKSQEDSLRELYKEGRDKLKNSKLRQDRLKKLRAAREKKKAEKGGVGKRHVKR